MGLAIIAYPQTEAEVAIMLCTLEAHAIPTFVHGGYLGGLMPGPQIADFNTRRIMVPEAHAAQAIEALQMLAPPAGPAARPGRSLRHTVRILVETALFGWFVPGTRAAPDDAHGEDGPPPQGPEMDQSRTRP